VHRFRLLSVEGDDLGPFRAAAPDWNQSDRIHRGRDANLVVVRLVEAEPGDDVYGYLVVEPTA
jgi:hypothetical protein